MKAPKKITIELDNEFVTKLDAVGYTEHFQKEIKESIEKIIERKYQILKENSKGITVKELLEEKLGKAVEFNQQHTNMSISIKDIEKIKEQGIKGIIKGSIVTCPIENDIVQDYHITTDEKVRKFTAANGSWRTVESYNIYISTNKGEFVYISALNTIKTLENYHEYIKKGLKYI